MSWDAIRALALEAVDASLRQLALKEPGDPLADRPVALPPADHRLEVWTTRTERWVEQQFYAVDADHEDGRPQDRHALELRHFTGRALHFTVPPATRAALGGARMVRVFCRSDITIKLTKALRDKLKAATRGDLVAELWSGRPVELRGWSPRWLPRDRTLNPDQQKALAAMTTDGAFFVWGPPGTGKTKVITAAVRHAVEQGRSVLIASHTHVAVDNVLEGLIEPPVPTSLSSPGVVMRVASAQTQSKVSAAVSGHDFLLVDKAAAVMTNHAVRHGALMQRRQANRDHAARGALVQCVEATTAVDADRVRGAQRAVTAAKKISVFEHDQRLLQARLAFALELALDVRHRDDAARDLALAEAEQLEASEDHRALQLDLQASQLRMTQDAGRWGWALGRRRRERAELQARCMELEAHVLRAQRRLRATTDQLQGALARLAAAEAVVNARASTDGDFAALGVAAERPDERVEAIRAAISETTDALEALRQAASAVPGAESIVADAQERGLLEQLDERDRLNGIVARLDAEARDIERAEELLADEMRTTRARLYAEAKVVACTLAGLTTNSELAKRRFDVVILDEVASADASSVVYAGSRADSTLALVGDFLQNAPIADPDDATTPKEQQIAAWQEQDVFSLAGIRSRTTAEAHPRCVPLRVQYRYPSVIADVVNAFCYDGMLESHHISTGADGPTITLIDTSRHAGKGLQRDGRSWYSPLGLELLASVARGLPEDAGNVGFVSPYSPQALRAARRMRTDGLEVECGTSHRFQGREFGTLILDLMQDDTERWVAVADLSGPKRAVSAAKLLNVAITRARRRLYLVGDWDYIRRHHSPGMSALAALEGHPNFEAVDAARFL